MAADPTFTETLTETPTETHTPTLTPSPSATETIVATDTPTLTPTASPVVSATPTITQPSTASPTLSPSLTTTPDSPLIDNFENDHSMEDAYDQRDAEWVIPGGAITEYRLFMTNNHEGNTSTCLMATYNKNNSIESAFFMAQNLNSGKNRTDFSTEQQLSLDVCGKVYLTIKLEDAKSPNGSTEDIIQIDIDSPYEWKKINCFYHDKQPKAIATCDLHCVNKILFFANPQRIGDGVFYIDNITLGPGSSPPPPLTRTMTTTCTPTVTPTAMPFGTGGFARPNPFVPSRGQKAFIALSPDITQAKYTIRIMNLNGKIVRTLHSQSEWDGRNAAGNLCEGGVYIYQVESPKYHRISGEVVLLK